MIQQFPFKQPMMNYLMDSVSGRILKKLHKTCKYFYIRKNCIIFDYLSICEDLTHKKLIGYKLQLSFEDADINLLKDNLIILEKLWLSNSQSLTIISKIVECSIRELKICCEITMEELKFLVKAGNVKDLTLDQKVNQLEKTCSVSPEEIFTLVPKATSIE